MEEEEHMKLGINQEAGLIKAKICMSITRYHHYSRQSANPTGRTEKVKESQFQIILNCNAD